MNFTLYKDIYYYPDPSDHDEKKMLDLYIPEGRSNLPVLFFIHAGGWQYGNKEIFSKVGKAFAPEGIVVAVINYRLSPGVMHPSHIEDVAMAFHWIYEHIQAYGGNRDKIYLFGYSSGGHLAALLLFNTKYMERNGLSSASIAGMVSISGVYNISEPMSLEEQFKIPAFGTNVADWNDASPILFVTHTNVPIILIYAEKDEESTKNQIRKFFDSLKEKGNEVRLVEMNKRDHFQILDTIDKDEDEIHSIVLEFCRH